MGRDVEPWLRVGLTLILPLPLPLTLIGWEVWSLGFELVAAVVFPLAVPEVESHRHLPSHYLSERHLDTPRAFG